MAVRAALPKDAAEPAAEALAAHGLKALAEPLPRIVAGFWPMRGEIDVRPLMQAFDRRGCRLALPVVAAPDRPLVFRAWNRAAPLERGVFGTRHPPEGAEILRPDLVLVPLLAFDAAGGRLGYGGGFYDRTLAALRRDAACNLPLRAVGIAYAAQELEQVPLELFDVKLDFVLTEQGVVGGPADARQGP